MPALYFRAPLAQFNVTMTRVLSNWLSAILFLLPASLLAQPATNVLAKSVVLDGSVAYLRIGVVGQNLPAEIQSAEQTFAATNNIAGTVLDLRFAGGDDMESAKAAEDFLTQEKMPVAILVNDETAGAAEKLAADLRAANAGLIFGSSAELKPDISVSVSAEAERKFMRNPYGTISTNQVAGAATNDFLPYIDHTTEADLVREKIKDGDQDADFAPPSAAAPQQPFIRDPVLARGVDFIKGLAVLRLSHS